MPAPIDALLIHAAAAWFMTGLIWIVQVVHYPLMAMVGSDRWPAYEQAHQRRITWIVAPAMLTEAATGAWLLLAPPARLAPERLPLLWLASALLVLIWVSTFLVQVPLHAKLERGFALDVHGRLVNSNWIRTLAWSARAVLVSMVLA